MIGSRIAIWALSFGGDGLRKRALRFLGRTRARGTLEALVEMLGRRSSSIDETGERRRELLDAIALQIDAEPARLLRSVSKGRITPYDLAYISQATGSPRTFVVELIPLLESRQAREPLYTAVRLQSEDGSIEPEIFFDLLDGTDRSDLLIELLQALADSGAWQPSLSRLCHLLARPESQQPGVRLARSLVEAETLDIDDTKPLWNLLRHRQSRTPATQLLLALGIEPTSSEKSILLAMATDDEPTLETAEAEIVGKILTEELAGSTLDENTLHWIQILGRNGGSLAAGRILDLLQRVFDGSIYTGRFLEAQEVKAGDHILQIPRGLETTSLQALDTMARRGTMPLREQRRYQGLCLQLYTRIIASAYSVSDGAGCSVELEVQSALLLHESDWPRPRSQSSRDFFFKHFGVDMAHRVVCLSRSLDHNIGEENMTHLLSFFRETSTATLARRAIAEVLEEQPGSVSIDHLKELADLTDPCTLTREIDLESDFYTTTYDVTEIDVSGLRSLARNELSRRAK